MEVFFYKYRKLLTAGAIFLLLAFPYEIYKAIGYISSGAKGEGIGSLLDAALMYLGVPIYFLVHIRKAYKSVTEKNAKIDQNINSKTPL